MNLIKQTGSMRNCDNIAWNPARIGLWGSQQRPDLIDHVFPCLRDSFALDEANSGAMTSLDLKEFTGLTKWSWPTNERIRSKWQEDKVAGEQWGGAANLLSYFTADCDQKLLITACNLVRSWSARPEALCQVFATLKSASWKFVLQGFGW